MADKFLDYLKKGKAAQATNLIERALNKKIRTALIEERSAVAGEVYSDGEELTEWDNRTNTEKRAPYDGPMPRGKHSHRCTGCKTKYGQTNAVACYKKGCTAPKLTDSCSHCRTVTPTATKEMA